MTSNKLKLQNYKTMLLVFLLACLTNISCKKDWLEAKVDKKLAVPETVKDFQAMLDYVSELNLSQYCLGPTEVAADGHYYTENDYNLMAPNSFHLQNAYTWSEVEPYVNLGSSFTLIYSGAYKNILNMNIVLNGIEKSKDPDIEGLTQLKGQALFNRAYNLFELAQTFAPAYNVSTANSQMGIALRLTTNVTEPSVRSTVKQTYDQIISDLINAKDILPNNAAFLTRASKPAVLGMLARVYLSMGDYKNALKYAIEYLNIKNTLLNYSSIPLTATFIGVNTEVSFLRFLVPYSVLTSKYLIDQSLYDSYDNNDLRKKNFFNVGANGVTFKGTYGNSPSDIFIGLSTDEIYLIRAEGYARSGNLSAAMKDLNDLLRSRWTKNPDGSTKYIDQIATDETDALRKIFVERKKQLILRGVRWTDLRRLNQDPRFAVTLKRTIGGKEYLLEPNSYRYTFPFPKEVIERSNMPQNPGW